MLENLNIVLVETRFPENIGAVARASANFGSSPLHLVQPERWDKEKAVPLATKQGVELLDSIQIHESLAKAVAASSFCIGTTARTGGVRREIWNPRECATQIVERLKVGESVSLVFGPEDRGLENNHLDLCQGLVTIPTSPLCSSLNLAQAVLLMVYECFLLIPKEKNKQKKDKGALSRRINNDERQLLHQKLKEALIDLDVIKGDNPEYFFLPMAKFLDRADVRRHEMDMLLGICRQLGHMKQRKE